MKKIIEEISLDDYEAALEVWNKEKPPYSMPHINSCVTAAKTIINYKLQQRDLGLDDFKQIPRLTKYEIEDYLRIVFNKAENASYFSNFPKNMGIKNRKLGEHPQMTILSARAKLKEMSEAKVDTASTVIAAIDSYRSDIDLRVRNKTIKKRSGETYKTRANALKKYFKETQVFSDLDIAQCILILNEIMNNESANYANELFDELKRIWVYCSPIYANGENIVKKLDVSYVSNRVKRAPAAEVFVRPDTIAELYINIGSAPSLHQKNTIRYMILLGVRPINVPSLQWSYLDNIEYPTKITYPAFDMKVAEDFIVPVTAEMRKILLEQRRWMEVNKHNCNLEYVFLQPSNPLEAFSVRSLDKLIKDYSPVDCVVGKFTKESVKGTNGAFNTMCRKFLKTNVKGLIFKKSKDLKEAILISNLVMHHSIDNKNTESSEYKEHMKKHYDFSEEQFGIEFQLRKEGFEAHESSLMKNIASFEGRCLRQTVMQRNVGLRAAENSERSQLRAELKALLGKAAYQTFNHSRINQTGELVKNLIKSRDGRDFIRQSLSIKSAA